MGSKPSSEGHHMESSHPPLETETSPSALSDITRSRSAFVSDRSREAPTGNSSSFLQRLQIMKYIEGVVTKRRTDVGEITERTRELISEQAIDQLKQEMSYIFRTRGDIQLLSEEKFTFTAIDRILEYNNPKLKNNFFKMLKDEIPKSYTDSANDDYRIKVQTARAFLYAYDYFIQTCELGYDPGTFEESSQQTQLAEYIIQTIRAKKKEILDNPDQIIFRDTKDRANSRRNMTSIDAGTASPQKAWAGRESADVRAKIEEELRTANLQENISAVWTKLKDDSHIRYVLDLSSLQLSYQGQTLKSLVQIKSPAGAVEDGVDATPIASKLITMDDKVYYILQTDKKEDVGSKITELVQPFLPGAQFEKIATARGTYALLDSYWQDKKVDWHIAVENRTSYYNTIHPAITRYVHSVMEHFVRQGEQEVTILDIAGGNGGLAERIIKDIQRTFPRLKINYKLVDYSKDDVNTANDRFITIYRCTSSDVQRTDLIAGRGRLHLKLLTVQ